MNKKMKKLVAVTVSSLGVLSQFPAAFCSGDTEETVLVNGICEPKEELIEEQKVEKKPFITLVDEKESLMQKTNGNINTYLKDFIDRHHYNPVSVDRSYFNRTSINYYFKNLETYVIYPDKSDEMKSYRPLFFPPRGNLEVLKKIHYKANSFYFGSFKNIVESKFGKAYILPLNVNEDLPEVRCNVTGEKCSLENGFKIVVLGEGFNEGKKIRFDFEGVSSEDIQDVLKNKIYSIRIKKHNKVIREIKNMNLENPYNMPVQEITKNSAKKFFSKNEIENSSSQVLNIDKNLGKIVIPQAAESMCANFLWGCKDVINVIISSSKIKTIPQGAFGECTSLEKVDISGAVKNIESYAFKGCINLRDVVLPKGLERIEEFAFEGCKNLEFITIPESVKFLGSAVFKGCDKLKCIKYGNKDYDSFKKFSEDFFKKNS